MNKSLIVTLTMLLSLSSQIAVAGTARIYNSDSVDYKVELKCNGSSKSITIKASSTSSYTFHSTAKSCDIVGSSVSFPSSKLTDGQKWKISNGSAKTM